jgi:hypothetical protein
MRRTALLHLFCMMAVVLSLVTGFCFGVASKSKAVATLGNANNTLILKRIGRQAAIWRRVIETLPDGPLEPEIGREQLEKYRRSLLEPKP